MRIGAVHELAATEAISGWKIWRVAHDDGRTRLRSVLFGSLWVPGRPAVADCKKLRHVRHEAPALGCECGIHAAKELEEWSLYLRVASADRVFGRVLLWGSVLEGERGWRGSLAYPLSIVVPAAVPDGEAVAQGLLAYGVPVETAVATPPVPVAGATR
jgi:hypothetical protein